MTSFFRMTQYGIRILIGALLAVVLASAVRFWWSSAEDKLAEVDGVVITASQVEESLGRSLSQLRQQMYEIQRQKLDELITAQLLSEEARRRGVAVATLLEEEVNAKILPISDEEILTLYNANRERIPVPLEQVRDQIHEFVRNQRIEAQKALYIQSLREKAKIVSHLKSPPAFRANVSILGDPFKGPEGAPVTIVKFEDFECPFCKKVQPVVAELLERYDGKLRLVHKDLPLDDIHPQARIAAEAARCAYDQGKFWEYHDQLYESAPKFSTEDLKRYAKKLGLNSAVFENCFDSGKYRAQVQKNFSEAARLGLRGTPVFFINGRELSGAQPLEAFTRMIDEELARAH